MKRTREVNAGVRAGSRIKSGKAWAREKRLEAQLQGRDRRRLGRVSYALAEPADEVATPLEKAILWVVGGAITVAFWLAVFSLAAAICLPACT